MLGAEAKSQQVGTGTEEMKLDINKLHGLLSEAYQENLDENGTPNNDTISGKLGEAMDLLEKVM